MFKPEILIISNKHDYACDYVCVCLQENNQIYLRLNTDDLSNFHVQLDPVNEKLEVKIYDELFSIEKGSLKSILYRGPTYLRETSISELSPEEKLSKSQWAAFIRALMIFDQCLWVNHPGATYTAETKALQLKIAHQVGFCIPQTLITNSDFWDSNVTSNPKGEVVVKGIDTIYLQVGDKQAFGYTNIVQQSDLTYDKLSLAPVFLQQYLEKKVDLRVTVIGEKVFAVEILIDSKGIDGDWRLLKDDVQYFPVNLPPEIENNCIKIVKKLGLKYGAIDLARVESTYYFIELNPTGEWAWLVDQANLRIDEAIANYLIPARGNECE